MTYLIRNWSKFQHFKTRNPSWIKLHHTILEDLDWHELNADDCKSLIMLWLVASEDQDLRGKLPDNRTLAFRLRVSEHEIKELINRLSRWICEDEPPCNASTDEVRASRYISDTTKAAVFDRDGGRCQAQSCGSAENIEYDHIIPTSQGGSGEKENIQLLCRSCGRRKRMKMKTERWATQKSAQKSQKSAHKSMSVDKNSKNEVKNSENEAQNSTPVDFYSTYAKRIAREEKETEIQEETEKKKRKQDGMVDANASPPPSGELGRKKSERKLATAGKSKNSGTLCPDDFLPSDKHYADGDAAGMSRLEIDAICRRMHDWSHANANRPIARKARWDIALHIFIRTEIEKRNPPLRSANAKDAIG
jgi:5-methylcytosine-specific restriction endonuclease McrA